MGKEDIGTYTLTSLGEDVTDVLDVFFERVRTEGPAKTRLSYYNIKDMVEMPEERKVVLYELLDMMVSLHILEYNE